MREKKGSVFEGTTVSTNDGKICHDAEPEPQAAVEILCLQNVELYARGIPNNFGVIGLRRDNELLQVAHWSSITCITLCDTVHRTIVPAGTVAQYPLTNFLWVKLLYSESYP